MWGLCLGGSGGGKAEGAGEGDDKGGLGSTAVVSDAQSSVGGGVMCNLVGCGGKVGDIAHVGEEVGCGCADGGEEGGGPAVEGVWCGWVAVVVDVRGEEVGEGWLGAGFEEEEHGVAVGQVGAELGEVGGVGCGGLLQELGGKGG